MAKLTCPDCGSTSVKKDPERGEIVCNKCGLVIDENMVQEGPEWRAFDSEQRNSRARAGAPLKYSSPNKGLSTVIDQYNRDAKGGKIAASQQARLYRMRKWHKRISISSSLERNLAIALTELSRVSTALGLGENIRETAAYMYRQCVQAGLIRGRQIETVVAAVVYAVCRNQDFPRSLDEIAAATNIPKKEIGRAYRLISRELNLKIPLTDPRLYIPRFVSSLNLSGQAQMKAKDILDQALKKGLISGRGPMGIAAAAVYIASIYTGERRTQKEVADVAGVTEVTIRNRYRELKKALNLSVSI